MKHLCVCVCVCVCVCTSLFISVCAPLSVCPPCLLPPSTIDTRLCPLLVWPSRWHQCICCWTSSTRRSAASAAGGCRRTSPACDTSASRPRWKSSVAAARSPSCGPGGTLCWPRWTQGGATTCSTCGSWRSTCSGCRQQGCSKTGDLWPARRPLAQSCPVTRRTLCNHPHLSTQLGFSSSTQFVW